MNHPAISQTVARPSFEASRIALARAAMAHSRSIPERLNDLIAAYPEHPRGLASKALFLVLSGRPEWLEQARQCAKMADALSVGTSLGLGERAFLDAALAASSGDWLTAITALEQALVADPEDGLAFKISHGLRFMLGDKAGMLKSARMQSQRLDADHPLKGYVAGCHAFACEENGFYAQAETLGMEALRLAPDDVWGLHAVSHVHEMQGRIGEGIAWLVSHEEKARGANNFGFHLFWHLALFLIEQGDIPSVFALYDREIRAEKTDDFRDLANAASLLMRLQLMGISVGNRWEELADKAEARLGTGYLAFADLHALMALHGAGRREALRSACHRLSAFGKDAPVAEAYVHGFEALARGRHQEAFAHFQPHLGSDSVLGGSDAQRDIFTQIAIDAGINSPARPALLAKLDARKSARGSRNRFAEQRLSALPPSNVKEKAALVPVLSAIDPRQALAIFSM